MCTRQSWVFVVASPNTLSSLVSISPRGPTDACAAAGASVSSSRRLCHLGSTSTAPLNTPHITFVLQAVSSHYSDIRRQLYSAELSTLVGRCQCAEPVDLHGLLHFRIKSIYQASQRPRPPLRSRAASAVISCVITKRTLTAVSMNWVYGISTVSARLAPVEPAQQEHRPPFHCFATAESLNVV